MVTFVVALSLAKRLRHLLRLMNRKFRSVHASDDPSVVLEMMRRQVLRHIPVLDDQGRVVQLLLLQELLSAELD